MDEALTLINATQAPAYRYRAIRAYFLNVRLTMALLKPYHCSQKLTLSLHHLLISEAQTAYYFHLRSRESESLTPPVGVSLSRPSHSYASAA